LGKDQTSLSSVALIKTDKASLLKNQIEEYKKYVKSLNLKDFPFNLDEILNVDDTQHENYQESWERIHFDGPIMIWALQKLDMIKMNVKMVEYEVLTGVCSFDSEV
jgi:hypothetical protein